MDDDLESMDRAALAAEVKRLRAAIREHRDSSRHELCWHHPELWSLVPEGRAALPEVPDWPQFLRGCIRYRESLDRELPRAPRTDQEFADEQRQPVQPAGALPPDDMGRKLTIAHPDRENLPHIGLARDTYTILLTGDDTAGRFCLIDMHGPPGGGPPLHRHDFEETFIVLEGELEATFRGARVVVRAGETINIPANAPHRFHNASTAPVRMLCICAPAGQEAFFREVGIAVATRTTPAPALSEAERARFKATAEALAPRYRTEMLD